ncbi:carbon-nitrogen family hydrolase [Streptomyces sp. NBC_01387]|uniref:carbon-nitrogen family hydrolase n=1 Tax=unclassified Streptomyces TaxID=2593676 RepID=UPI00224F97D6|nr:MULTISPECIES: carbon-nitrogen family hydrolase [unclassified Streptomyces]MCX4549711.1 carbon-nitrogen family hydrolase [Streptomyces sp. NBC_01500]
MRASLLQIAVNPAESPDSRRLRVADLVREQSGADFVVLPELWPVGAFAFESFAAEAEPLDGPTHEAMAKAASDAAVWLHAGSIVERAPDGSLYNTSLVFSPEGERAAVYRKIHRFGFDKGEAVLMAAGEQPVTVDLPAATVGLATCYDLRFPELFRALTDAGAQLLVIPAGWPERRRAHWTLLAQARAVENQSYVLACGTAGTHAGVQQAGHSIVVDPWGEVLAEAGADEQVLTVELDPSLVARTREQFPALKDRRLGLAPPSLSPAQSPLSSAQSPQHRS